MILNVSSIKYKLFGVMHDYPVDVWMMWCILVITILAVIIKLYYNLTDESEIQQFILRP